MFLLVHTSEKPLFYAFFLSLPDQINVTFECVYHMWLVVFKSVVFLFDFCNRAWYSRGLQYTRGLLEELV